MYGKRVDAHNKKIVNFISMKLQEKLKQNSQKLGHIREEAESDAAASSNMSSNVKIDLKNFEAES